MVDQALVNAKVAYGFTKAANAVGSVCQWYRPVGAGAALATTNLLGTMQVLFDTKPDMQQREPSRADRPLDWFGALDITAVQAGDYLVDPVLGTFFVSAVEYLKPARLTLCNRVLTVARPGVPAPGAPTSAELVLGQTPPAPVPGPGYYGGDAATTATVLLTSWPAGVIQSSKRSMGTPELPGDVSLPWADVYLPESVPLQLRFADTALDDQTQPMRYIFSSVEQTPYGWRMTASVEAV